MIINFVFTMFTTWFQITKYCMMVFFTCTILFNFMGVSYLCIRSILDNTLTKDVKNFLQVLWKLGINFALITKDMTIKIGAMLFITDRTFMESTKHIPYEDRYTERFSKYMDIMIYQEKTNSMGIITDKTMLFEYTPVGNVLMKYDANNHHFVYYSNRALTTLQLQSIGRKFIIDFSCPGIIQQMKKNNDSEEKLIKNNYDKEAIDDTTTTNKIAGGGIASRIGVMAKLKTQQSQPKKPINKKENETLDEYHEKLIEKDPYIDFVNHFKFVKKGQLADISFTQPIKHPRIPRKNNNTMLQNTNDKQEHVNETKQITSSGKEYLTNQSNLHEKHADLRNVDKSKLSFAEYKILMNKFNYTD